MFNDPILKRTIQKYSFYQTGFTLIELVVVIIIIGILASIGLPVYNQVVEKARSREALITLKTIYDAQMRRCLEYGSYIVPTAADSSIVSSLDINITDPGKYFNFGLSAADADCSNGLQANGGIAWAERLSGSYFILINETGAIWTFGTGAPPI